ncbi:MAG TPA: hypothetical protein VNA67_06790 [Pseudonocardiaceae bacterium]|nr:hypothetical protein [Pseudonocardiaceae bacterium]
MKHRPAAELAQTLAHDLDEDLAGTRARDLDRELDRALARTVDSAYKLARALPNGGNLYAALGLTGALTCGLARTRNIACARPCARNLIGTLDRARGRAHSLGSILTENWAADAGRVPRDLVALVVRILPEHDRQRVWEELCAELEELPPEERLGHARRALASVWELRRALTETVRPPDDEPGPPDDEPGHQAER